MGFGERSLYNWLQWPCYAFCKYTRRDAGMHSGKKKKREKTKPDAGLCAVHSCVRWIDLVASTTYCRQPPRRFAKVHHNIPTNLWDAFNCLCMCYQSYCVLTRNAFSTWSQKCYFCDFPQTCILHIWTCISTTISCCVTDHNQSLFV